MKRATQARTQEGANERGAAMVLFAITLTVLMAMSAFAVDTGLLFIQRRENQTAADTGVLGGALDLNLGMNASSEKAAAIVRTNLSTDYTDAEWIALWAGCTDSGAMMFTGEVLGTATQCISFDGLGTYRVIVPDQDVPTAFAGAIGIESFTSGAVAEVELTIEGVGGVLPFAVLGSASSGSQICLRSSSGGTATPPCTGSAAGNFGALQVAQWGNEALGTDALSCNLNKSDQLAVNISVGIDHFIRVWDGVDVDDTCAMPFGPNTLPTFNGISGGLFEGMIVGETVQSTYFQGRLTRGSTQKLNLTKGNSTYPIDNVPLWQYIAYGKAGFVPATCTRESFDSTVAGSGHAAAEAQLATCLIDYAAGSGFAELFDLDANADGIHDIVGSPRYGVVPQFHETSFPSGGSANMHIAGYRAVFVQGLYFGCNGNSCSDIVTPGAQAGPVSIPNGSSPLDQITGFLLPNGTVPDELVSNGVNGSLGAYQIRLSR